MVAKITVPATLKRALNYNEKKVQEGKAVCLYAHQFLKEAGHLRFYEKWHRFEHQMALNQRAQTTAVHISLNFAPGEGLTEETMRNIALEYMEKIGFGKQPYLVYQHLDAGHPHLHIVTTNIQSDGRRISLHNLGRTASTRARKELEKSYRLVPAEGKARREEARPAPVQRVRYGKAPTGPAITHVLDAVLPLYRYASLAELNAVLKGYNLRADRGKKEGTLYKHRGLVYRVLDEKGRPIGVPLKASSLDKKPTLVFLEQKFRENESLKQPFKKKLQTSLDWILAHPFKSLNALAAALEKEKISLVTRHNEEGLLYGLTYIDHRTRCVFNGSDLGKAYSAKGVLDRCVRLSAGAGNREEGRAAATGVPEREKAPVPGQHLSPANPLEALLAPPAPEPVPYGLRKRKKKRKKMP